MHHIVYKTTQKSTGRWYIGKHSTNNLEDGYMGSGTEISAAIKENPEDFEREVLCECDSSEEAYEAEARLMSPGVLVENYDMIFNRIPGGNLTRRSIFSWAKWKPGKKIPPTTYAVDVNEDKLTKLSFFNKSGVARVSYGTIKHEAYYNSSYLKMNATLSKISRPAYRAFYSKAIDFGSGNYITITMKSDYMFIFIDSLWTKANVIHKRGKEYISEDFFLRPNPAGGFKLSKYNPGNIYDGLSTEELSKLVSQRDVEIQELKIALENANLKARKHYAKICELRDRMK